MLIFGLRILAMILKVFFKVYGLKLTFFSYLHRSFSPVSATKVIKINYPQFKIQIEDSFWVQKLVGFRIFGFGYGLPSLIYSRGGKRGCIISQPRLALHPGKIQALSGVLQEGDL